MSQEQRCPSSNRDCHGNYRSDKRGLLLYEDAGPPIPEAMRRGPMSDDEFEEYRRDAYRAMKERSDAIMVEVEAVEEERRRVAAITDDEVLQDIQEIAEWVKFQVERSQWRLGAMQW